MSTDPTAAAFPEQDERPSETAAPGPKGAAVVVSAADVFKSYGETKALRGCSFEVRAGEIHAIVGENGSGKSTLAKVLSGVAPFDSGTVQVCGRPVGGSRAQLRRSIATVYQEILLVDSASVVDNVYLGYDSFTRATASRAEKRRRVDELLLRLTGTSIDVDALAGGMSLQVKQWIVIARALIRETPVLVFDESTAALDVDDTARLAVELQRIRARGHSVVLVTHRIKELQTMADRATVLRNGQSVATVGADDLTEDTLLRMMSGRDLTVHREHPVTSRTRSGDRRPDEALRVRGLKVTETSDAIDLQVLAGEIVGLAGLEEQGQRRFLECLAGVVRPAAGEITVNGGDGWTEIHDDRQARRAGVSYVPGDRKREGIFPAMAISSNFAMTTMSEDSSAGVLRRSSLLRRLDAFAQQLKMKMASPRHTISTLSGGNQQKVIIARSLAESPRVLLLSDPMRGVDIETKRDLYAALADVADSGVAIVFLSSETEEFARLCDRTLVFRDQAVHTSLPGDAPNDVVLDCMFGREAPAAMTPQGRP